MSFEAIGITKTMETGIWSLERKQVNNSFQIKGRQVMVSFRKDEKPEVFPAAKRILLSTARLREVGQIHSDMG